jgi:hypothetical protein
MPVGGCGGAVCGNTACSFVFFGFVFFGFDFMAVYRQRHLDSICFKAPNENSAQLLRL